jgi:outer membrane receptor protein involved in Fe transport
LNDTDPLPAVGLNWRFHKKMVLRAYYARTLNRPDFRELSPATFNDVTGGRQVFGNPDIKRATIDNLDLRWEWYLGRGDNLSVAGFFKEFHDPIETIVVVSAQHSVTFENAKGARNAGFELTAHKRFGFVHKSLRDVYISGNFAFIWSRISLREGSGIQTNANRPLEGQSPFVLNLRLGYDNADVGTTVTLLYNVFGQRIAQVGALGAPDILEEPFHRLDLVYKQKLGMGFSLTFKAKNLLDLPARFTQGGNMVERWRKGRVFSIDIAKKW